MFNRDLEVFVLYYVMGVYTESTDSLIYSLSPMYCKRTFFCGTKFLQNPFQCAKPKFSQNIKFTAQGHMLHSIHT